MFYLTIVKKYDVTVTLGWPDSKFVIINLKTDSLIFILLSTIFVYLPIHLYNEISSYKICKTKLQTVSRWSQQDKLLDTYRPSCRKKQKRCCVIVQELTIGLIKWLRPNGLKMCSYVEKCAEFKNQTLKKIGWYTKVLCATEYPRGRQYLKIALKWGYPSMFIILTM